MRPVCAPPATLSGLEHLVERLLRAAESFPPCDVLWAGDGRLRITLAVAGFAADELSVVVAGDQLVVRGRRHPDTVRRQYLHHGIAMRRFQRSFLLGAGLQVNAARLENGLLNIELERTTQPAGRRLPIGSPSPGAA